MRNEILLQNQMGGVGSNEGQNDNVVHDNFVATEAEVFNFDPFNVWFCMYS